MNDPLYFYYLKIGFDPSLINNIVTGEKYVALRLNNGNIGVCATLNIIVDLEKVPDPIDIEKIEHRIVYNAYINAIINYNNDYQEEKDIFDKLSFRKYQSITMIGFFQSLYEKFQNEGISLTIFDKVLKNDLLTSMEQQIIKVSKSDAVILTSTSIFNKTFKEIIRNTPDRCDVFLLGPSSIMSKEILSTRNVKMIFGAIFSKNDNRILNIIKEGGGTKSFLPYMKKVFIN